MKFPWEVAIECAIRRTFPRSQRPRHVERRRGALSENNWGRVQFARERELLQRCRPSAMHACVPLDERFSGGDSRRSFVWWRPNQAGPSPTSVARAQSMSLRETDRTLPTLSIQAERDRRRGPRCTQVRNGWSAHERSAGTVRRTTNPQQRCRTNGSCFRSAKKSAFSSTTARPQSGVISGNDFRVAICRSKYLRGALETP